MYVHTDVYIRIYVYINECVHLCTYVYVCCMVRSPVPMATEATPYVDPRNTTVLSGTVRKPNPGMKTLVGNCCVMIPDVI